MLLLTTCASAAAPPFDTHSLVEVRTLAALPRELSTAMGWHTPDSHGIADTFERFNSTDVPDGRLPMRRFLIGGMSSVNALLVYEQGARAGSFHAVALSRGSAAWDKVGEWSLSERPFRLSRLLAMVDPDGYPNEARLWRREQTMLRIYAARPLRRDGPLRELNLSDDEVREIQAVALQFFPGAILNISGVVTGCPCEEGPGCSDQVWIVVHRRSRLNGLQLSHIDNHWTMGVIQHWWLDFEQLNTENSARNALYNKQLQDLYDRYPGCGSNSDGNAAGVPP